MPRPSVNPQETAATAGGAGLAGLTRLVAALRPAAKPLHPRGDLVTGRLTRRGLAVPVGVLWLDEPGVDDVLVRRSRAVGLPEGFPDIHGLAVRVPLAGGGHGDLLLAMTGSGRLSRFVLTVGRTPYSRPLTTLLPYRTPAGPRLIRAVACDAQSYRLAVAAPGGAWLELGLLELAATSGPDPTLSFDPVRHPIPGLETYEWVRRLREPAYATARRSRHQDDERAAPGIGTARS